MVTCVCYFLENQIHHCVISNIYYILMQDDWFARLQELELNNQTGKKVVRELKVYREKAFSKREKEETQQISRRF